MEKIMAKRILIVDDNELMTEVMTYILTGSGYEVIALNGGDNIFNDIKTVRPDLLILDALLPGMDGRDICMLIKLNRDTQNLPVIICSGNDNIDDALSQKGAPNDVLHKPFNIDNLIEKVEHQLAA
ncbi:response regulator [Mucilaginibacter dorajii]|uniref:Response regulatory domain-containing protein n=1 Tax=Mucilaginibacter dorajii TaxID=692994 RepID=A0ABP7PUV3_9SPHI|nr:response regulator [Mucilaginibacter dorajii]MCS3735029.1 DNA-binding response OmpR family regulator [Mucilaginibacter dorajii]